MAAAVSIAVAAVGVFAPAASAHPVDVSETPCKNVEAVFARGSGQKTGGNEAKEFARKLGERLAPVLTTNTYELGTEPLTIKNVYGL